MSTRVSWIFANRVRYRAGVSIIACQHVIGAIATNVFPYPRFGVVIAFATNAYLHQGVENATFTAREGVDDTQRFLRTTSVEANHLLNRNYEELSTHLTDMLQGKFILFVEYSECIHIVPHFRNVRFCDRSTGRKIAGRLPHAIIGVCRCTSAYSRQSDTNANYYEEPAHQCLSIERRIAHRETCSAGNSATLPIGRMPGHS